MVHELVINGNTYQFKLGIKFMRDVNKRAERKIDGLDITEKIGMSLMIASLIDGDIDELFYALRFANEGFTPRLEPSEFDKWIEDDSTDIDAVFKEVLGFFEKSNCCKTTYRKVKAQADAVGA